MLLQLDDHEAEAHCYLGEAIRALEWNYSAEERELERALDLDPNSAICHLFLGMLLASRGEHDRVWTELATAEKLDPLSPMISNFHGSLLLSAGRVEEALAKGLRTKEIDPTYVYFESSLAQAYREQGKFAESIAEYKREETMSGETPPGLAITYARMGRTDEARQILQQLEAAARTRYVEADLIAAIYVALGDNDRAFQWLERAFAEHSAPLEGIGTRLDFKPLASDPRFPAFLRRIGLDPAKFPNRPWEK